MVIDMRHDEIASWWFEALAIDLTTSEKQLLRPFLEIVQSAALILEEFKLLFPNEIVFDEWVTFDQKNEGLIRRKRPDLSIELGESQHVKDLADFIFSELEATFGDGDFLYPLEIKITGPGIILDAAGAETEWSNVAWIQAVTFGVQVVNICTQSYAWMPYDLSGRPQFQISQNNGPRLEAALAKISNRLGTNPIVEPTTDYAVIEGFRVSNLLDVDGEPIEIILE